MFQNKSQNQLSEKDMSFKILDKNNNQEVVAFFTPTVSSSEGEEEGKIIGDLASELSSIFFTRLSFNDSISVYMLTPVAVNTKYQGKGIGQAKGRNI